MNEITKSNELLWDIIEVYSAKTEYEANKRLQQGWKLIDTITTCYDPELFYKHQTIHYILGRKSDTPEYFDDNQTPESFESL